MIASDCVTSLRLLQKMLVSSLSSTAQMASGRALRWPSFTPSCRDCSSVQLQVSHAKRFTLQILQAQSERAWAGSSDTTSGPQGYDTDTMGAQSRVERMDDHPKLEFSTHCSACSKLESGQGLGHAPLGLCRAAQQHALEIVASKVCLVPQHAANCDSPH